MSKTPEQRVEKIRKFILDNWAEFENILRHNNWKMPENDLEVVRFFYPRECPKSDISNFINKLKAMISKDNWYTFYRKLMLNKGMKAQIGYEMFQKNCVNDDGLRAFIVHYTDCDITPLTYEINEINKNYIKDKTAMYTKFNDNEFDSRLNEFLEFYGFSTAKTIDKLLEVMRKDGNTKRKIFKSHPLGSLYIAAKGKIQHRDYQDSSEKKYITAKELKISINHKLTELFLPSLEWKDIKDAY